LPPTNLIRTAASRVTLWTTARPRHGFQTAK